MNLMGVTNGQLHVGNVAEDSLENQSEIFGGEIPQWELLVSGAEYSLKKQLLA